MPIVIYSIIDRDGDEHVLERSSKYYFPGPKELYFNVVVFWEWFASASIQALIITAIV